MDTTYKPYMDDFNAYKRFKIQPLCRCGCDAHCGNSCMTDDCECTDCECSKCSQGQGYN